MAPPAATDPDDSVVVFQPFEARPSKKQKKHSDGAIFLLRMLTGSHVGNVLTAAYFLFAA